MRRGRSGSEIVYVERSGDASAKWLFWGALLGAGLALLYAPRSGEETRRLVQRRLWKLRAMTEEKLDEFTQQLGARGRREQLESEDVDALDAADYGDEPRTGTARQDLERRLTEARSRRRAAAADVEEPLA
jgi:gas vesicle protein